MASINDLPDEILGKILSLVSTKVAASTSVLSKRWRNLLSLVDNLDLDDTERRSVGKPTAATVACFLEFVDRTLVLLGDSPIKKLSLRRLCPLDESGHNRMISNVLKRGVLELHLSTAVFEAIDPHFYFCKTLVKLTLSDGRYGLDIHGNGNGVLFPALRTLSLNQVCYYDAFEAVNLYESLVSSSPLLEEFNICDDAPRRLGWLREVSSSSIKRTTIFYHSHELENYWGVGIRIQTPNLVYLDYSSYVAQDYHLQFDSLVEARLDLILWKYNNDYISTKHNAWGDATNLVAAIRNVVTLHLSADSLEVFYYCCKYMPEFSNLVKLSFESHEERGWQVLPLLLKKSPNLETLVIKGLVHKITDQCGDACVCVHRNNKKKKRRKKTCCLLSCRVKVLKIYGYGGSGGELKQLRHFMENLRYLEVVKVKIQVAQQDNYLILSNELMNLLPSNCKIQII